VKAEMAFYDKQGVLGASLSWTVLGNKEHCLPRQHVLKDVHAWFFVLIIVFVNYVIFCRTAKNSSTV
jgi:hypothetical protein